MTSKYLLKSPDNPALEYSYSFEQLEAGYRDGTLSRECEVRSREEERSYLLRELIEGKKATAPFASIQSPSATDARVSLSVLTDVMLPFSSVLRLVVQFFLASALLAAVIWALWILVFRLWGQLIPR